MKCCILWCSAILILLFLAACERNEATADSEIRKFHSGSLIMSVKKNVPRVVFVDMRAPSGELVRLPPAIESEILKDDFKLTDAPSKAGYILHINILKEGEASPENLREMVEAGYGNAAGFEGEGSPAMLVDAILVQRNVPQSKRPSRERMKNISSRNALDSGQMRIGLYLDGPEDDPARLRELFYASLASELGQALDPHTLTQ